MELGYRIELPAPWRRSDCLSAPDHSTLPTGEGFVAVPEESETGTDTGFPFDQVRVTVDANPNHLTAGEWVASGRVGTSVTQTVEPTTRDGKTGVIVRAGASLAFALVLPVDDRMYVVGYMAMLNSTSVPVMERMVSSFHLLSPAERTAAATPPPAPRSAEQVADILGDGFAASDADLLATVMVPCMSAFLEQAGGTGMPRAAYVKRLRDSFAAGLRVTVQRRPIEGDSAGMFVRAVWVQPNVPTRRGDLFMRRDGQRWSWYLVLTRQKL